MIQGALATLFFFCTTFFFTTSKPAAPRFAIFEAWVPLAIASGAWLTATLSFPMWTHHRSGDE
jgi:hypothetical protein